MDVSSGQLQEMATNVLDKMLVCAKTQQQEKKPRPQQDQALKCPRCDSTNTKFCYYNNYSLSQPRYFCKSCRRYWTKGGTLRNVPIGGGCRKTKRSSKIRTNQDHQFVGSNCNLPNYDSNDLNLVQKGYLGFDHLSILGNPSNPNHDFVPNPNFASFLDTQNPNFMYFGYGNGIGEVESNGAFVGGEMVNVINPYEEINGTQAVTMTTVKQELCNANSGSDQDRNSNFIGCPRSDDNKVLWGYPWQFNGNELDSTRESWINGGFVGLASHGLLNSTPLM